MSMLPIWLVAKVGGKLGIQCPYQDCAGKAVVSMKWSQPLMAEHPDGRTTMIVGRSCTYCCRTSQVPEKFKGGKPRG